MKRFQTLVTGISAIALVAAFAAPTLAAKTVITDEELDEVTAAGQPKIAQAESDSGSATAVNFQVNIFAAHIDGQQELTALTLNNIFGENQIANGTNIQSGTSNSTPNRTLPDGTVVPGGQSNFALQSWGSAKAYEAEVVSGAAGGAGGTVDRCVALIAKCAAGNAGNRAPAKIALLWAFADEIAEAESDTGPAVAANIVVTVIATAFGAGEDGEAGAQENLTALTVNNVFGFNQVANGLNISSGAINGGINAATTGTAANQSNQADQWRGAPVDWNTVPTFN